MREKICNILFIFLFLGSIAYLYSKGTYTIYESKVEGEASSDIAKWSIKVNDTPVTEVDSDIVISDINFESSHVVPNKVAPGSSGKIKISIDPFETEVAIYYELEIIDKRIDSNKILTFQSIESDRELIRTGVNTYAGIISLEDITNKKVNNVLLSVKWIDDLDIDVDSSDFTSDDFITVNFKAVQYMGEEVSEFTG